VCAKTAGSDALRSVYARYRYSSTASATHLHLFLRAAAAMILLLGGHHRVSTVYAVPCVLGAVARAACDRDREFGMLHYFRFAFFNTPYCKSHL
jgi:hypothetical protein